MAEKKEFLERHVVEKTTEYVLAEDGLPMIARMVVEENNKAFDTDELNELNKEKAQLINDIQSLVDSLLDAPQSAKKPIMERMALLEERKADLEIAIHKKKLESGIELTEEQMIAWLKLFCDGNADDEYFRERIINTFLNCVYVYPDKIVIFYNTKKSQEVYFIDFDEYQTAMCSDKSSDTMLSGGA